MRSSPEAGRPARAGASGTSVHGILLSRETEDIKHRILPGIVRAGPLVPGLQRTRRGSDLALRSARVPITRTVTSTSSPGHKVWTSYSDHADWCFLLARTDHEVPNTRALGVRGGDAPARGASSGR